MPAIISVGMLIAGMARSYRHNSIHPTMLSTIKQKPVVVRSLNFSHCKCAKARLLISCNNTATLGPRVIFISLARPLH